MEELRRTRGVDLKPQLESQQEVLPIFSYDFLEANPCLYQLNDALTKELDDVAKEFDEMQEQNQRVLLQLKEIEDNNTTLVTEVRRVISVCCQGLMFFLLQRLKLQYAEQRLRNELDVLVKKNQNVSGQLQLYEQQERSLRAQILSVNDLLVCRISSVVRMSLILSQEKSHEEARLLQALADEHKRTVGPLSFVSLHADAIAVSGDRMR